MKAVIQAGGKGTRLRPYTSVLPKPLMPIGARPVLELLLKWLRRNGITQIYVTTGYLGHLIRSYCGDGGQWNISITYTQEHEPLGTIGPLSMLRDNLDCTFIVLNGDVLTDLDLNAFINAHRRHGGLLTVATTTRSLKMDYGVIDGDAGRITRFMEKPTLTNSVSMGVYCMEPEILDLIPGGVPFGFDNLVVGMLDSGTPAHFYMHQGLWLDVGRIEDFQFAQEVDWSDPMPAREALSA